MARADIDDVGQDGRVEPVAESHVHGFADAEDTDRGEVVVDLLGGEPGTGGTAVEDAGCFAHGCDDAFDPGEERGGAADHEGQGSGEGAVRAA